MKKKNKKKRNNKIYYVIIAIVLLVLIGFGLFKLLKKDDIDDDSLNYYYAYATNDWYNVNLAINRKIPAGIATYSTREEAIAAFPKNYLSRKPYLIMHWVHIDTILESYILFDKDGKYYRIRGGYNANNLSDDEKKAIHAQNKKTMINAFGQEKCSDVNEDDYSCESTYELAEGKWTILVKSDGRVRVAGYDSFCVIDKLGTSGCGVTPE